jgi:hypothetical protein
MIRRIHLMKVPSRIPIEGKRALVIRDYTAVYANPLEALAGTRLELGRRDDEYPGWVWCIAPDGRAADGHAADGHAADGHAVDGHAADGRAGWTPLAWLDQAGATAILRRNYTARELTIQQGQAVILLELESGWWWAQTEDGQTGWLPANCLQELE